MHHVAAAVGHCGPTLHGCCVRLACIPQACAVQVHPWVVWIFWAGKPCLCPSPVSAQAAEAGRLLLLLLLLREYGMLHMGLLPHQGCAC